MAKFALQCRTRVHFAARRQAFFPAGILWGPAPYQAPGGAPLRVLAGSGCLT